MVGKALEEEEDMEARASAGVLVDVPMEIGSDYHVR
jgi:hypothetical protein